MLAPTLPTTGAMRPTGITQATGGTSLADRSRFEPGRNLFEVYEPVA